MTKTKKAKLETENFVFWEFVRGPTSSSPLTFFYQEFILLQTEVVDVKRDKCEAFATGQTASHLINLKKMRSFLT